MTLLHVPFKNAELIACYEKTSRNHKWAFSLFDRSAVCAT